MIKKYPKIHIKKLHTGIQKEIIQLLKMHNEGNIHTIFIEFDVEFTFYGFISQ
ncbi:hypothetical protein GIB67_029353 [Kingdonia uniflora]|uniref:Uncharacterized protein n=1 Tax=Kingdonia uniflora TaxID=39325 RepID=A0A7J7M5E5_9MAGN|nr:hypothetical protein GIB67_029353 [Kingdonia uniflora]